MFDAVLIKKSDSGQEVGLSKVETAQLPQGDVLVDVAWSKRPRFTVYASRNGMALAASTFIAGDVGRLGYIDLRPYKVELAREGISVIDTTDIQQKDMLGHTAFAENSDMLKALATRLPNQRIDTDDAGLGLRIARTEASIVRSAIASSVRLLQSGY